MPGITCDHCGRLFIVTPFRQDTARFCSRTCKQASERDSIELICLQCGESYSIYRHRADISKFCSNDCRTAYYATHGHPLFNRVTVACEQCGESYKVKPSKAETTRFCSRACLGDWRSEIMSGPNHPNWKGGPIDDYGSNWLHQRRLTIERDLCCQACGAVHSQNGDGLDVHHIIPIREFGGNWKQANRLINLIALCRVCHAKVECGQLECPIP